MKATKFLFGAMVALMMVACSSKESMIKDYEKACKDGKTMKAAQISDKLQEKYGSELTEEDNARILDATFVLLEKTGENMGNMMSGTVDMMNSASDMLNSLNDMQEDEE